MTRFEKELLVPAEESQIPLRKRCWLSWADFILNPRRIRGSDFLMRWSQGVWSEQRLVQAVESTGRYYALPYGPSGTAPQDDIREFELYFERLEAAGLGQLKRPDLLIFRKADKARVQSLVEKAGGEKQLPFTLESDPTMKDLLRLALIAVECENSLWIATQMPDYGSTLKPMRRLGGQPGLKKNAVLPTVIIKEEDRTPLLTWQQQAGKAIHMWHVFYDLAYGIALDRVEELISTGQIAPHSQTFQAPGGATTTKVIYKVYYQYAYPLARSTENPKLAADKTVDANGHILPYVRFEGGKVKLEPEAIAMLDDVAQNRGEN